MIPIRARLVGSVPVAVLLVDPDLLWVTPEALCAQTDPEAFFPEKGDSTQRAKRMCRGCPLISACLDYALTHPVYGVWGGTSQIDRSRLRRGAA